MNTPIVKINIGEHTGEHAFITWGDADYIRVTPINGDPLVSLEFSVRGDDVIFLTEQEQEDILQG